MAHIVFLRTAAADLTAGKPPLRGVPASAPLSAAAAAIPASQEADVAVWRDGASPLAPAAATVIGLLSSLDVVAFLASHLGDAAAAMRTPAGDVVAHEPALVREVEPHTREMPMPLRVNVIQLSIRACKVDRNSGANEARSKAGPGAQEHLGSVHRRRQEAVRAILQGRAEDHGDAEGGSLGEGRRPAIAAVGVRLRQVLLPDAGRHHPLPDQLPRRAGADPAAVHLSLGAVNRSYAHVEASSPAIESSWRVPSEPRAVAVVQTNRDGSHKVLADVSAHRLWRRDYAAAADSMASLSSLNFAAGVDGHGMVAPGEDDDANVAAPSPRSSRLGGGKAAFEASLVGQMMMASHGGNAALRCRSTSSLAAVMAQMLSYRTTHIWVTDGEDDVLVGVVGYTEIFNAVTRGVAPPPPA
ncbi:unnamed protein product [Miscanthus lutarioriparius]|uniref:CBS domain-containing protein n=1 Tax=Miscanthus lutarioriparius TaxID=422564 RepID=A0A811PK41_9POAL|nr:unnamed protein product [Miscanthus lutarioriparius]